MSPVLESNGHIPTEEFSNLSNDFDQLLDKPIVGFDNPAVSDWKPIADHGTAEQISRYMELVARVDKLNAKERQEFHDLMEIVAVEEPDLSLKPRVEKNGRFIMVFEGKIVVSEATKEEMVNKALLFIDGLSNERRYNVEDGKSRLTKVELKKYFASL